GRVRGKSSAVADVEAVDCLHQTADGLLEKICITKCVMAEPLRDVGGEADVSRGEPMLQMDVAIVNSTNGQGMSRFVTAVVPDELGHRPWLERRPMLSQARKVPNKGSD